jgi:hypothetical protein
LRAYKLIFGTLLLVVLLAVVVEGTIFDVLARLWAQFQRELPTWM